MKERVVPLGTLIKNIQIDVIQVQQFLQDVSATRGQNGLDGGFEEAAGYAERFAQDVAKAKALAEDLGRADMRDGLDGAATIEEVSAISRSIITSVDEQASATREIARSIEDVARGTRDVRADIDVVDQSTRETTTAAGSMVAAADQLGDVADRLRREVDGFVARIRA
mgnify:CR=1 FL=1